MKEILQFDLCGYTVNKNGVFDEDGDLVVSLPIFPVSKCEIDDGYLIGIRRLDNRDLGDVFVKLQNLEDAKNLSKLSKLGVLALNSTVGPIAAYLYELVMMNFELLKELTFAQTFGWHGKNFLPYDGDFLLAEELERHPYFSRGSFYEWRKVLVHHRDNLVVRIAIAASFASVLIKILAAENLLVVISGLSEDGKSVLMRLMASVWGDPRKNSGQVRTALSTAYNNEVVNLKLGGLPLFLDETATRTLDDSTLATELMRLAEGVEKGRNKKLFGGSWSNSVVLTSEFPLVSSKSNVGLANRVLQLEGSDGGKIFGSDEESKFVIRTINENFGFAGRLFIDSVKEIGFKAIGKRYDETIDELERACEDGEVKISHKILRQFALIYLADSLASEIFDRNIDDGTPVGSIGLEDLIDFISKYHAPNPADEFLQKLRSVIQHELSRNGSRVFKNKRLPPGFCLILRSALSAGILSDFKRFAAALKQQNKLLLYRGSYWWPKTISGVRIDALCVKVCD